MTSKFKIAVVALLVIGSIIGGSMLGVTTYANANQNPLQDGEGGGYTGGSSGYDCEVNGLNWLLMLLSPGLFQELWC